MKQNYTKGKKEVAPYLGLISIDSLKLRIPLDKVTIIDESILSEKHLVDATTGNIEKTFRQTRYIHKEDGITTSIGIEKQITGEQKVQDYLVLLFNSKLLHEKYFDGITSDNIETVYYRLMALKKVSFSYEDFLSGSATDVDYKKDIVTNDINDKIRLMHFFAKESKKTNVGCNVFTQNGNKGIEFGKRETATPAHPFLKVYHKGLEAMNNSKEFYRKYLVQHDIQNLVRVETTIKNRKHFKKYGIEDTTLKSILNIAEDKLSEIFKDVISLHLNKRIIAAKTPSDMKPSDAVHYASITSLMSLSIPYNSIRETLVGAISDSVGRSRMRKKLDDIYDNAIAGKEADSISKHQETFFESMGWS